MTVSMTAKSAAALLLTMAATMAAGPAARAADVAAEPETIVLKAAHLFDGTGVTLKNAATIVVHGDRIVSIGGTPPAGARTIDLGDATLLPGFIDSHTHLTMQLEKDYYKGRYNDIMRFPAEKALYGALYAKRTVEAGFTTVRNVGADDFIDISLRNAIKAGVTEGPRMITAAHGIGSPGGHFDDSGHLQRPRGMPRGGALPDEVGCGRHQDCRQRWRAVRD
jgi:imidazolonepropionase-like amidohydrolase